MPDLKPFFSVNAWGDSLTTGATLKIVHSLHYSDYNASPFMALLTDKPAAELQKMLKDSEGAEKSIYEKLKTAVSEWEAQAAQTLLLEKVLEYVRTPEVSHTSNEWKQIEGGAWEISNRVYQMRYQFTPVPQSKAVRVTWGIVYNTPQQSGNARYANSWGDSRYIVRQDKKPYDSVEAVYPGPVQPVRPPVHGAVPACAQRLQADVHGQRPPSPRLHPRTPEADEGGSRQGSAGLSGGRGRCAIRSFIGGTASPGTQARPIPRKTRPDSGQEKNQP